MKCPKCKTERDPECKKSEDYQTIQIHVITYEPIVYIYACKCGHKWAKVKDSEGHVTIIERPDDIRLLTLHSK